MSTQCSVSSTTFPSRLYHQHEVKGENRNRYPVTNTDNPPRKTTLEWLGKTFLFVERQTSTRKVRSLPAESSRVSLISTNIKTIQVETLRRNYRESYYACPHLRLYTTSVHETLLPPVAPTPTLPLNVLGGFPVVSTGSTAALLTRVVLGMMRIVKMVLQHVLSRSFLGGLARSARPYICRGCQGWRRTSDPPHRSAHT